MQDGPFGYSGSINTSSLCEGAEQYTILHILFQISQTSTVLPLCTTLYICASVHLALQQLHPFLQSVDAQKTHAAAVDMYSAPQPNVLQCVCKSAGSWRASPNCLVIGRELSGGDGLWCWCIYLLRRWEEAPPMSWLTGRRPALLCLTRSGWRGVCLLTRWNVHEDDRKTFP